MRRALIHKAKEIGEGFCLPINPKGWKRVREDSHGAAYRSTRNEGTAICSMDVESDGKRWVHLSLAHPNRLPTYQELCDARDAFLGNEARCIQVFAPKSEHVNIHKYCLHLWHCLDDDGLPDFRRFGALI